VIQVYIVEALRRGDRERHSYVVGAYSTRQRAQSAADAEGLWREGTYQCVVWATPLDKIDPKKLADFERECK